MSKKEIAFIKSDTIISSFKNHLNDEFNERILFSAPFGAGKSTFLKNFFDESEDYIILKLYPVNYSVAPNQDVFEIIKYELLYELLSRFPEEIELQQDQFSMLLISQMFFLHQMKIDLPLKLLAKASSLVTGLGIADETIVDPIIQTISSFNDYKKDINKTEYDLLMNHIKIVQKQKGHIYESDEITQLIISLLERVKEKKIESNPNAKTVLLIDDLDRLDPEHVFRLFNVFSAHYDDVTESNKFNLDKVIFVCDVKNIREMFNHKYGFNVEFTGYIDKFYSTEVFRFDIKKYLKESLSIIFNQSIYNPNRFFEIGTIDNSLIDRYSLHANRQFYKAFDYILRSMVDFDIVRIRNFKRFNQFTLPNHVISTKYGMLGSVVFPVLVILHNLEKLFIHQIDLENAFEHLYKNYNSSYEYTNKDNRDQSDLEGNILIHYSIPFILDEKLLFGYQSEETIQYSYPYVNENGSQIFIVYTMNYDWENSHHFSKYLNTTLENDTVEGVVKSPPVIRPNPYWFLYNAYKNYKKRNY
jgi:hypothetical protein